jgi:hypothetical protein
MNMFKSTAAKTPEEYIKLIDDEQRRKDIESLHKMILDIAPALKPHIMSGMLAYGSYSYKYSSGAEGQWSLISLASQKNYISLYICALDNNGKYLAEAYRNSLPKANIGKSCVRFKKLHDVELDTIKDLIKTASKAQPLMPRVK